MPQHYQFLALAFVLFFLLSAIKSKLSPKDYTIADYSKSDIRNYAKQNSILTRPELILYRVLRKHMNNDFIISPKVRLADFVKVKKGPRSGPNSTTAAFNRISSKHADFLICALDGSPLFWIELDDNSHNTKRAKKADKFKDDVANYVGIPLHRIKTGSDYNKAISALKSSQL